MNEMALETTIEYKSIGNAKLARPGSPRIGSFLIHSTPLTIFIINMRQGTVSINGPMTREEKARIATIGTPRTGISREKLASTKRQTSIIRAWQEYRNVIEDDIVHTRAQCLTCRRRSILPDLVATMTLASVSITFLPLRRTSLCRRAMYDKI